MEDKEENEIKPKTEQTYTSQSEIAAKYDQKEDAKLVGNLTVGQLKTILDSVEFIEDIDKLELSREEQKECKNIWRKRQSVLNCL